MRGYDISNISLVEGESGWIVIDPLTSTETARAAMDLVREHLGDRPVTAVIYTHSHIDHFAGLAGVIDLEERAARNVPIVAPEGFLREAVSENVIAGPAMLLRRRLHVRQPPPARSARPGRLGRTLGAGRLGLACRTDP